MNRIPVLFALSVIFAATQPLLAVDAETMNEARERIIDRLQVLDDLWNRGLTGESNEGYVAPRSSLSSSQLTLIEEENRDRTILFEYISEKTGAQLLSVGQERAMMVERMAKNGLWVQAPNGDWKRK